MKINIPNQITLARLVLAIVFFALLSGFSAQRLPQDRWILNLCFWLFLVAALADVLDGIVARAMHQVTSFGRVVDPVVDKVMVCGAFIFFASFHFYDFENKKNLSHVAPWMVVVILVRELLVSAIRAHREAQGHDFGATWVGKLKMFVQSATICVILGQVAWHHPNLAWLPQLCVWITVVVTALSTVSYVRRANAFLFSGEALGGTPQPDPSQPPSPTSTAQSEASEKAVAPAKQSLGASA